MKCESKEPERAGESRADFGAKQRLKTGMWDLCMVEI